MKTNILLIAVFFLTACSAEKKINVEIVNNSAVDRTEEVIEIAWNSLTKLQANSVVVLNEEGLEIPSQILYNGQESPYSLIFPATVPANTKKAYCIKAGVPGEFPVKTYGRQFPERKDDFAWENDRVVYRVYGPALADEYPSNGYDLWLKKTDALIVNKFYKDDLENGISYHVDHGEGLDCYKVGHTLGAGAIAPFADNKIRVENHYTTVKVLDTGILRTTFELIYDSVWVGNEVLSEKIIVSLDAGSQFNKAVVSYSGDFKTLDLAAGIYLHAELGTIVTNQELGTIAYAENAVSDAGVPAGRNYVGVVFTSPVKEIFQDAEHIAGVTGYSNNQSLVYYFGGGWSQSGFSSDIDWFEHVEEFAKKINAPLEVKF
ncbi:MAG: DUF4861 domain-containing protein [Dysgonamonadaceae bacterium]|jgi:hypothetical protein|nr:DUF4861 domain-containing protein [Dysgonamonadaceae bacterium]